MPAALDQVKEAKENLEILMEMSKLLNVGLDPEPLAICVRLCELGVNPEALALLVENMKKEVARLDQSKATVTSSSHTPSF